MPHSKRLPVAELQNREESPQHEDNLLLNALSASVRKFIFPHLKLTELQLGQALYESGVVIRDIYFPTDAIVALQNEMTDGRATEIAVVGNEGVVGFALIMGGRSTSSRAVVHSAGHAYRLPDRLLKDQFCCHDELHHLLLRYSQALITQVAQTAVCNRFHSIDQQLCRWLLLSMDRVKGDELKMTQELIANLLGVRREGVTAAACKLAQDGIIRYKRGNITILDRPELERRSCECYAVVKRESDRLLGHSSCPQGAAVEPLRLQR